MKSSSSSCLCICTDYRDCHDPPQLRAQGLNMGWISALPSELEAAIIILDERYENDENIVR